MAIYRSNRALSAILAAGLGLIPAGMPATLAAPPQNAPGGQEAPVFEVQASAVVVDVVVRDKKGRLVRDLAASDFDVFEDNVKQTVGSFHVVDNQAPAAPESEAGGQATAANPPATAAPAVARPAPAAPGAPSVIAFVFDRLSQNARRTAQKAALSYADHGHTPGDLVAVFSIDLALRTLQPFTNDVSLIKQGLNKAGAQGNTAFASDREEARGRQDADLRADQNLAALSGAAAGSTGAQTGIGLVAAQQVSDQMQANMLRTFDSLERDQQGYATTNGLLAVVNGLKAIPGRKTVVFFSEGIAIPANVLAQFRSVISSANRANVSVYAIDAGGLRVESGTREAREEIVQASARRAAFEASGRDKSDGSMTRAFERTEDMLRLNPESGLGQLAEETGGFLVRDTNDVGRGFGRIQEDMRFHYLLSYSPTNENLDGAFRNISIKVKRPGVEVQTRKGYFAIRPDSSVPVRAYEAPGIAYLDKKPRPDAFPIRAMALSFPESDRPGLASVMVEIPGTALAWAPQKPAGFSARFSVVARIKNEQGHEVDRLSQQYNLNAPADKLDSARAGNVLFYREAQIPPGRYTVDVVAFDSQAQTASVRTVACEVPATDDEHLRLSSLIVVSRVEKITAAEQKEGKNPLFYGETIVYPNMGVPLRKSTTPALGFYFSIYGKNAALAKNATIEIQRDGHVLAKTTSPLPAPDAKGRIQQAAALPLDAFVPGEYTLKVSVNDGPSVLTRSTPFTVAE